MSRTTERELIFKLLYMSGFYDQKELGNELILYFDAPFPVTDDVDFSEELLTLKDALKDEERHNVVNKYTMVVDKLDEIDGKISSVSKGWSLDRIGKIELAVLRLAIFEIEYDDDVPASVAINEAVELAKKYGPGEAYVFVNGILSQFA